MTVGARLRGGPVPRPRDSGGPALFSYGFRPFFLLAGIWAPLALILWMAMFYGTFDVPTVLDPLDWHAHELLFGFAGAAVAGFTLTAVPNWTGRLPLQGLALFMLVVLWLAGRVTVACSAMVGGWTAAVIDVAFLATLTAALAREIYVGRNWRNVPVIVAVAILTFANGLFYVEALGRGDAPRLAERLAIAVLIVLIALIGGRIIPSFTRNWLAKRGPGRLPAGFTGFDKVTLAATVVAMACWTVAPETRLTGLAMAVTALLHLVRLARWAGARTAREPLLWVLHLGYFWIPVGLGLLAASALTGRVASSAGLHALTSGAITLMIIAVMTRATRGHTGRALHAGAGTTVLYLLALAAAASRVSAALLPAWSMALMAVAAAAWVAAFAIFLLLYAPMLVLPRVRSDA